ncbi:MAG: AAA family ATPase [Betaproteobacteria bacterium]|nr:AAA family ATPase [Betaproteobacteria bacterium]
MFRPAERVETRLRAALTGPSGSGKTWTALVLAKGLGGKWALIDTENGSAALYADRFTFDVCQLDPPYTVDKYIEAMKAASDGGYMGMIVDSASHQWSGEGGILDRKEKLDARGGNSFTNWGQLTPEHERFRAAILRPRIHLIATMRSKVAYVLEEDKRGKQVPRKVGMAPIQREGMDYEFDLVLDLDIKHQALASKDRTGLFSPTIPFAPTEETGKQIIAWLRTGKSLIRAWVEEQVGNPALSNAGALRTWWAKVKPKVREKATYDDFARIAAYIEAEISKAAAPASDSAAPAEGHQQPTA